MEFVGVCGLLFRMLVRMMLKRPACGLLGTTGLVPGVIVPFMELEKVLRFVSVT